MKTSETPRMEKAEQSFALLTALVVLLILPMWGAMAMLAGSAVGLAAYAALFRKQLRSRGLLKVVIPGVVAAAMAAAIAFALGWGHWH